MLSKGQATSLAKMATRAMSSASSSMTPWALPLNLPTAQEENAAFKGRTTQVKEFFESPRFKDIKRPYSAEVVATKQGNLPALPLPSSLLSDKLHALLTKAAEEKKPVHTMGAIDPIQMTQMARHQQVVYVSGWACSSVLTTANNEVGPDLADYPYTTVPNQVHRIFRAQQHHDRKIYDERMSAMPDQRAKMENIDYLRPIIADGDTGHGGLSSVMKMIKLFAESGASAIHLEDQLHGGKKCGHQAGKVLVPVGAHVSRLIASRFQLDVLQSTMMLIARTDAESAKLISSSIDTLDHPFILGTTKKGDGKGLAEILAEAEQRGASGAEVDKLEAAWMAEHQLSTFEEAVESAIESSSVQDKKAAVEQYRQASAEKSNSESRVIAREIVGRDVEWDWDLPRTREGYYHYKGGVEAALMRVKQYASYADMLWLETKEPNLDQAKGFARNIREAYPGKWLVYNLTPTDTELKNFVWDLAKEGFVLQLISLAGLHSNAVTTHELSKRYAEDGMLAYVELIQRKEKETGCDVLTHQKWSGANYVDRILSAVSAGSASTSAMGKDSTEHSF
ncbi:hypothetical protein FRB96_000369 [Tulasnella sp. 330]|nr:hypothetical protein FRB96_000369 [Tulasnella sp. 330]KAG8885001.1 hypothetical protein FRB97_002508 [Tulasnella sp. 331]